MHIDEDLTLEVSVIPIVREEKKMGVAVVLHNITREKRVEQMKTEFVSIAAHQLRTPLSAIKWTLIALLDGDLGGITKEQEKYIKRTHESNERMIGLINDLLNVSRIEEGRYLYKPKLVHLKELIQPLIDESKIAAEKKKVSFEFKHPVKKLPQIRADAEKIKLAVQNFLENAIMYSSAGKKIIASLEFNKKEKQIEFHVQDEGIGIPSKQKDRIFTKFFRAANAVRMETVGNGLGLFITKNIVEAHGGKIWFESKEGKGSVFCFSIPVKNEIEEFVENF